MKYDEVKGHGGPFGSRRMGPKVNHAAGEGRGGVVGGLAAAAPCEMYAVL